MGEHLLLNLFGGIVLRQRFSFTIVVVLAMLTIVTVIVAVPVKAETSGPIAIMGDEDLRPKAELYDWPGDGTADSP